MFTPLKNHRAKLLSEAVGTAAAGLYPQAAVEGHGAPSTKSTRAVDLVRKLPTKAGPLLLKGTLEVGYALITCGAA